MAKYAAFLRAINVGGHRVTNAELGSLFEALGLRDVRTFRASGNVIFTADVEPTAELSARIEQGLGEALGFEATTFLRTADEVRAICSLDPFAPALMQASTGKLQVAILSERPPASTQAAVLALSTDRDGLAFGERELLWLPSGAMMDSALDLKTVASLLGPMTLRTMNTIEQIAEKHLGE